MHAQRIKTKRLACNRQTTANTCSGFQPPGFATFASAKPPANVMYSQHVASNAKKMTPTI